MRIFRRTVDDEKSLKSVTVCSTPRGKLPAPISGPWRKRFAGLAPVQCAWRLCRLARAACNYFGVKQVLRVRRFDGPDDPVGLPRSKAVRRSGETRCRAVGEGDIPQFR